MTELVIVVNETLYLLYITGMIKVLNSLIVNCRDYAEQCSDYLAICLSYYCCSRFLDQIAWKVDWC